MTTELLENHRQEVHKIDTTVVELQEYCPIEDAFAEAVKNINNNVFKSLFKKSDLKFQRVKSNLLPFWLVEAKHTIDYEYQTLLNIPINEANTTQLVINGTTYDVKNPAYQKSIEVPAKGIAHYKKEISYIFNAEGLLIQNDSTYREYITRHNSDDNALDEITSPSLNELNLIDKIPPAKQNIERKITSEFYKLTESTTDNTQDFKDIVEFTKFNLYYHPIFTFEYINTETEELKEIEVDGITGKVIKGNMLTSIKNILSNNREGITEMAAEIAGSAIPGTGYLVREIGKRI
ncbi:MAG: hypothetical protein Q4D86_10055 [Pasteurella oralis]|uniref:hypothetical protein n=1 Tax=Pasteurella oralis TaxID=1071947 RepID=UPI0026FE05E7|nr:hypothetical protein [Pasteurella oralis]